MSTALERIAALESTLRELDRRLTLLDAQVNGGASVEYRESMRGRLHSMQSALAAADRLKEAAEAAARAQREATHTVEAAHNRRFSTLTQTIVAVCAVVAVVTPYVFHFAA